MKSLNQVLAEDFTRRDLGYWAQDFGPEGRFQLAVEPMLYGDVCIAIYDNETLELVIPQKLLVRSAADDPAHD